MSLLVDVIHENTPKIVVTAPPKVIEGEIKHGYEQVTGFQNILSPNQEDTAEKQTKHAYQGSSTIGGRLSSVSGRLSSVVGSHKHQRSSTEQSSIEEPDDSSQKLDELCSFDIGNPVSNNNNSKLNPDRKYLRQSSADSRHLRENGYLIENENVWHKKNSTISAPKAPGRIRTSKSESDSFQDSSKSMQSFSELRRHSSQRNPLQRQNAKELVELSPDIEIHVHVSGDKRNFDSTCL